jgi:hypothetical protein
MARKRVTRHAAFAQRPEEVKRIGIELVTSGLQS